MSASVRETAVSFSLQAVDALGSVAMSVPGGVIVVEVLRQLLQLVQGTLANPALCRGLAERCFVVTQTVFELSKGAAPTPAYAAALASFTATLQSCAAAIESFGKKRAIWKIGGARRTAETFAALQQQLVGDIQLLTFGLSVHNKLQLDGLRRRVGESMVDAAKADALECVEQARAELSEATKRGSASKSEQESAKVAIMMAKFADLQKAADAQSKSRSGSQIGGTAPADSLASLAEISLLDIDLDEQSLRAANQPGVFVLDGVWMGSLVTVKRLASGAGALPKNERQAFEREAHIASSLRHPRIAQLFGFNFAHDNCLLLVLEHTTMSLHDVIYAKPPAAAPSVDKRLQFAVDVAHALVFAHSRGVLHRALRASSCIIADDGRAKLSDFALAKSTSVATVVSAGADDLRFTAPEVILDSKAFTAKADVYALGMLLFELVCLRSPWDSAAEFSAKIVARLVQHKELVRPDVPDGTPCREVMHQCWHFDAAARPLASVIAADLQEQQRRRSNAKSD